MIMAAELTLPSGSNSAGRVSASQAGPATSPIDRNTALSCIPVRRIESRRALKFVVQGSRFQRTRTPGGGGDSTDALCACSKQDPAGSARCRRHECPLRAKRASSVSASPGQVVTWVLVRLGTLSQP